LETGGMRRQPWYPFEPRIAADVVQNPIGINGLELSPWRWSAERNISDDLARRTIRLLHSCCSLSAALP
jgi:hypothetical protein